MRERDHQHAELRELADQRPGPSEQRETVQRSHLARGEMRHELPQPPKLCPAPPPDIRGNRPHAVLKNRFTQFAMSRFDVYTRAANRGGLMSDYAAADDVEPVVHESRDRAITAVVTVAPILALGFVAWQLW